MRRYFLTCELVNTEEDRADAAVAAFEFFDESGALLGGAHRGYSKSASFDAYRYFPCATREGEGKGIAVEAPPGAWRIRVRLMAWKVPAVRAMSALTLRGIDVPVADTAQSSPDPVQAAPAPSMERTTAAAAKRGAVVAEARIDLGAAETFAVRAELHIDGVVADKALVLSVQYRDAVYAPIRPPYPGFVNSPAIGEYRYVTPAPLGDSRYVLNEFVEPPPDAASVKITLREWTVSPTPVRPMEVRRITWREHVQGLNLERLSDHALHRLADLSVKQGDLEATLHLRDTIFRRTMREADGLRVTAVRGLLTELDTTWLPRVMVPKRPDFSPRPERICHLFKVIYPQESSGGSVRNWNIVRAQARAGMEPIACLSVVAEDLVDERAADVATRDGIAEVERDGVTVVYPRYSAFVRKRAASDLLLEVETNLHARAIMRHGCSLVHAASGFKGFDNALKGLSLARYFDLPFVYEVRSFHEHTWGPLGPRTLTAPLTKLRSRQEDRCMLEADAVITISDAMVGELVGRGVPRDKVFLVPNSVDDAFLQPPNEALVADLRRKYGLEGKTVVGYISNVSRREGHAVLLEAFATLARARSDVACLFVGAGPELDHLQRFAVELGVADRLVCTGEVMHDVIREHYALIDVFVVPRLPDYASDYVTPMKPFEVMALGSKLIMSDRPVSAEVIGREERGLMFRTGDAGDLAKKIGLVLSDPEAAQERALRGQKWVRRHRTWTNNAGIYQEIYAFARRRHSECRPLGRVSIEG